MAHDGARGQEQAVFSRMVKPNMKKLFLTLCLLAAGCSNEPDPTRFYKVTLYSGNEPVRQWLTCYKPLCWSQSSRVDFTDTLTRTEYTIYGTVVVEGIVFKGANQ
jgi:hypothetical protein